LLLRNAEHRREIADAARAAAVSSYDRREIARQSAQLYEQACSRFIARRQYAMIKTDPHGHVAGLTRLLDQFDHMIYMHVYRRSFVSRLKYWYHMIKARPKLGSVGLLFAMAGRTAASLKLKRVQSSCDHMTAKLGTGPSAARQLVKK
jgi:hypothetical protein